MNRDEELFDKIERYLRGELSEEENRAMKQAIAEDPDLAEELEFQQLELDAMDLILEDKLRKQMGNWKQTPPPPAEEIKPKRKGWWLWGTLVVALFAVVLWLVISSSNGRIDDITPPVPPVEDPYNRDGSKRDESSGAQAGNEDEKNNPTKKRIEEAIRIPAVDEAGQSVAITTYELPQEWDGTLKSPGELVNSPLDSGLLAFFRKDYRKAIVELSKIQPSTGEDIYLQAQEVLGHAYFSNGQYPAAARIFSRLARTQPQNQDFNTLRQDAEWYYILALLPEYSIRREQIKKLLVPILDPNNYHNHQREAEELQGRLLENKKLEF